jgi:putative intracellular protease/amidase
MKRLLILLLLTSVFLSCAERTPKVLLYVRGDGLNSWDLDYMLKKEASVMKDIFEQSGFDVIVATISGEPISSDSSSVIPDLKLDEVIIADYAGFIIPCMADSGEIATESITLVKEFIKVGKPVAAQFGGVNVLAKAGVLKGKKYAIYQEPDLIEFPEFENAVYSGRGVIQDGNIITSGICPYMARAEKLQDGTLELTQTLIKAMKI